MKANTDWKWLVSTILTVVALLLAAGWIHHDLTEMSVKVKAVEDAVRIIASGQGENIEKLIDEVLKVAQSRAESGNVESARNLIGSANDMIARLKDARKPPAGCFFPVTLYTYRGLVNSASDERITNAALSGMVQLAEYRSALTTTPKNFHPTNAIAASGNFDSGGIGHHLNETLVTGQETGTGTDEINIDNFVIENVVFEDVTIIYKGGPLTLRNVWFINCQFKISNAPKVSQLLEAVIQQPSNIAIS